MKGIGHGVVSGKDSKRSMLLSQFRVEDAFGRQCLQLIPVLSGKSQAGRVGFRARHRLGAASKHNAKHEALRRIRFGV